MQAIIATPGPLHTPPLPPPTVSQPWFKLPAETFASAVLPFDRRLFESDKLPRFLEPSERKRLTLFIPPQQKGPLADGLIGENNDFTKGWTSSIMPWGMLHVCKYHPSAKLPSMKIYGGEYMLISNILHDIHM